MRFTWNCLEKRLGLTTRSSFAILSLVLVAATALQGCGGSGSGGTAPLDGAGPVSNGGDIPVPGGSGGGVGAGGVLGTGGVAGTIDAALVGGSGGPDASTTPACGQPGTPCCPGNGCSGGGCCVSGICMAVGGSCVVLGGGVCKDGACGACGAAGLPCCTSTTGAGTCTSASTVCTAGTCALCGGLGSPCCAPATAGGAGTCTDANAICSSGRCLACGQPSGPCCTGDKCIGGGCCFGGACAAEGATCGAGGGVCQATQCSGCGSLGQACCGTSCYGGLLCKGGACAACGGLGQSCCTGAAACQAGMACTSTGADGLCAKCGSLGDVCCAGATCAEGCCSGGHCLAPGTPACPIATLDGGQPDVPMGGGGGAVGSGGAGGRGGAGGTVATGGTTTRTGGALGSGGVVSSGGVASSGGVVSSGGVASSGGVVQTGGTTEPPWTPPAGCGDLVVVAPEQCDDGNTMPFDGCSSDCRIEPVCNSSGPCTSRCGDGVVVGEECDDGNTIDGDGCSSACKVETGFVCGQPDLGDTILVPAVYRDFRYHNPTDFEAGVTGSEKASLGMVAAALDADGKPVYTGLTGSPIHVASATTFATWYRNTAGVNHATASKLKMWSSGNGTFANRWGANGERWPITHTAYFCGYVGAEARDINGNAIPCSYQTDSGVYSTDCDKYIAQGEQLISCSLDSYGEVYRGLFATQFVDGTPTFFPVDDDTFTPASERTYAQIPPLYDASKAWPRDVDAAGNPRMHNFSFTSEIRYWFRYDTDKTYRFDITGDDDVWVFINKQLAIDVGGIHTPVDGPFTLDTAAATKLGLVAGNVYEVAVFQAERQSTSSTFRITLPGWNSAPSACTRATPMVRRR